ncbi:MAG: hypothetical protein WDM77_14510 [Steroidobacteraceae bacterium]
MTPTKRLQLVQKVTDEKQRQHARRLAQSRARVAQCEVKLKELRGYQAGYIKDFDRRAADGIAGVGIREFQGFSGKACRGGPAAGRTAAQGPERQRI